MLRIFLTIIAIYMFVSISASNELLNGSNGTNDNVEKVTTETGGLPNDSHFNRPNTEPDDGQSPFCKSIIVEARERRYFLIEKKLTEVLVQAEKRMIALNAKKVELESWIQRREDFAKQATDKLVEIYSSMKPEASAARLAKVETELAASILLAIPARQAGVILNEMDEKVAADITVIMAASARKKDPS